MFYGYFTHFLASVIFNFNNRIKMLVQKWSLVTLEPK